MLSMPFFPVLVRGLSKTCMTQLLTHTVLRWPEPLLFGLDSDLLLGSRSIRTLSLALTIFFLSSPTERCLLRSLTQALFLDSPVLPFLALAPLRFPVGPTASHFSAPVDSLVVVFIEPPYGGSSCPYHLLLLMLRNRDRIYISDAIAVCCRQRCPSVRTPALLT